VKRMQEGMNVPGQPLSNLIRRGLSALSPRRSGTSLMREIARVEAAGGDASALRAELAQIQRGIVPEVGAGPVATPSSAPGITSAPASQMDMASVLNAPQGVHICVASRLAEQPRPQRGWPLQWLDPQRSHLVLPRLPVSSSCRKWR